MLKEYYGDWNNLYQIVTKIKDSNFDKTQKTQIVTKLKKTQIVTKLKNSIVTKLKNLNCDKTQKL